MERVSVVFTVMVLILLRQKRLPVRLYQGWCSTMLCFMHVRYDVITVVYSGVVHF